MADFSRQPLQVRQYSRLRGISQQANGSSTAATRGGEAMPGLSLRAVFLRRTGFPRQAIKQRASILAQRHQLIKLAGHAFRHAVAQIAALLL